MALSANRELKFYTSQELIEVPIDDKVNIFAWFIIEDISHDPANEKHRHLYLVRHPSGEYEDIQRLPL